MSRLAGPSNASTFPLVEDRAKGLKLVSVMILGRALRDVFVPTGSQMGRGIYAGAVVGAMLYLLARPAIAQSRAALWAVLGGLATAVIIAW